MGQEKWRKLAKYLNAKYALLKHRLYIVGSLAIGINVEMKVFHILATPITLLGAKPVFVDIKMILI